MLVVAWVILGVLCTLVLLVSVSALVLTDLRTKFEEYFGHNLRTPTIRSVGISPIWTPQLMENHMKDDEVLNQWDPQAITASLRKFHDNPQLVRYFIDSVIERLILGQDYRTSNSRIRFLQNQIKELTVANEYLIAQDNLAFHAMEKEIRHRELELKREDLENKRKRQQELEELKLELEKLKIRVEITQLNKQIDQTKDS